MRPTSVQEQALLAAIDSDDRRISTATYADRTITIMERNRWIEIEDGTMRVLPEGARALNLFTLAERYAREDALASDPVAQHTEQIVKRAVKLGFGVDPVSFDRQHTTVTISAMDLEVLLSAYETTRAALASS